MGYATGAAGGAGSGAAIGSAFGGVGAPIGAVLGGLLGLAGADDEAKKREAQNKVETAKAITNPWLHMTPEALPQVGGIGEAINQAGSGLALAQNIKGADAQKEFQQSLLKGQQQAGNQRDIELMIEAKKAGLNPAALGLSPKQSPWMGSFSQMPSSGNVI